MSHPPIHKIDSKNNMDDITKVKNEQIISVMTHDELFKLVGKFEDKFCINKPGNLSIDDALSFFGYTDFANVQAEKVYMILKENMDRALTPLMTRLIQEKFNAPDGERRPLFEIEFDESPGVSIGSRVNRCIAVLQYMGKMLLDYTELNMRKASPVTNSKFDHRNIGACTTYEPEDSEGTMNDYQHVILYVLDHFKTMDYRRYRDYVCKQIGKTRAWEKIDKIETYVEKLFDKLTHNDMWRKFTKTGTMRKNLIEHLSVCHDSQFPELVKNRHVFSFKNGLYVAKDINNKPRFYDYDSDDFLRLDPTVVSAKYFDIDFDANEYEHWYDIPTPALDTILDYQKFPRDVKECILYFIGRMLYNVNEMEKWQVVMFLKGMASTGKGMICQVATYFYEDEDVGTMSDNPEKQFGLSAIYDKFCFIAPEITSRFSLGQADFQSMISGESVSVGRKYKTAESVRWGVPGIFAGNEPPGYHDNSGSIQRRLVTIPFPVQVRPEDIDTELPDKLRMEIPKILRKANEGYHDAISRFTKGGIWAHLPQLVKNTREEMALSTNALRHFMASPAVVYSPEKKIPKSLFIQFFNEHCKANNLGKYKFTPDFYNGPFSTKNISIEQTTIIYGNAMRQYKNQPIIMGLDVIDDDYDDFSNDH